MIITDLTTCPKYNIIYADPPWQFRNKNTGGSFTSGSANQYSVMSVEDLCKLQIPAAENAILFSWWVASQPEEALAVVKSWGFELKTMTGFCWVKLTKNLKQHFGMGKWTRAGVENCLIAIKGHTERISASVRSVFFEEEIFDVVRKHSQKPGIVRERIVELCGDVPRIELFAREEVFGWDSFGDQLKPPI